MKVLVMWLNGKSILKSWINDTSYWWIPGTCQAYLSSASIIRGPEDKSQNEQTWLKYVEIQEPILFVNYSYNSLWLSFFRKYIKRTHGYVPKYGHYGIFYFIWGIRYEHILTDIHASDPAILILYIPMVNNQLHWCLLNALVKCHFKLSVIFLWEKCIAS